MQKNVRTALSNPPPAVTRYLNKTFACPPPPSRSSRGSGGSPLVFVPQRGFMPEVGSWARAFVPSPAVA